MRQTDKLNKGARSVFSNDRLPFAEKLDRENQFDPLDDVLNLEVLFDSKPLLETESASELEEVLDLEVLALHGRNDLHFLFDIE